MISKWKNSASLATIVVASGLATSALSTPAQAGGLEPSYKPAAQPPMVAQTNWKGFYAGAHIGGGEASWDGRFDQPVAGATPTSQVFVDRLDTEGLLGGIHAGFNWQHGRTVFGIEGGVSLMDWEDTQDAANSSEEVKGEVDALASVRGRIGVTVGDDQSTLLYVTGGVAWADAQATAFASGQGGAFVEPFDFSEVGGVVGGGFEWAATDRFRVRTESLYYWFDERKASVGDPGDGAGAQNPTDNVEFKDAWTVRIGGSWYFTRHDRTAMK